MAKFHRVLGVLLLGLYVYVVTHHAQVLPEMVVKPRPALFGGVHADIPAFGYAVFFALPLVAILCFLFAPRLKRWLSPRTRPSYDFWLGDNFWYTLGYVALIGGVAILMSYR